MTMRSPVRRSRSALSLWAMGALVSLAAALLPAGQGARGAGPEPAPKQQAPAAEEVETPQAPADKPAPEGAPQPADPQAAKEKAAPPQPAGKQGAPPGDAPARWLKQFLRPIGKVPPPPPPKQRRGRTEKDAAERAELRIPENAPCKTDVMATLRKARAHAEAREWSTACEALQRLLDEPDDSICRLPGGKWGSVRGEVRRILTACPPEALETYRRQYAGIARQRLQEALETDNSAVIVEVALRYPLTEAGDEAANRLGSRHFDRGEFGLAARWFEGLYETDAVLSRKPAWRLKGALAARRAGLPELAEKLLKGLDSGRLPPGQAEVGGGPVEATVWLEAHSRSRSPAPAALEEWPLFYGSPQHNGVAAGGDPLLLKRWSQPTSQSAPVRTQLSYLLEDLDYQGCTPLPTFFPLMVGGKVIFRTLHGVQVVDADTGRIAWETPDEVSAERLLAEMPSDELMPFSQRVNFAMGRNVLVPRHFGGSAEYHPLTSLLFRNANYGIISSDAEGRRLYVVEDQPILSHRPPGQVFGEDAPDADGFGRSYSTNRLSAYDLNTGRSLWEVGGPVLNDPFELPLAGRFFFGAPVVDGDELLVVGEKGNEIRLFALDPRTGAEKWSQLIAYSDVKIESDLVRQWWTCEVAAGSGVIVCPTTVGWLVGLDRQTHAVLWAHRYAGERRRRDPAAGMGQEPVPLAQLNEAWAPAPPIIVGNHLLYTAPEESQLICLNLLTGVRLWQKPRQGYLYLAGAFGDHVLLVGNKRVAALKLASGNIAWTLPLESADDRPAGHGVFVGNRYHLPLASGALWSIDLQTGKVVQKSYLSHKAGEPKSGDPKSGDDDARLGNLAMYRGMLVSLSARGLTTFEQRESVEGEIQKRLAADAADPWANLRQAEIATLNRKSEEGLAALHRLDPAKLSPEHADRRRSLLLQTLTAIVMSDFQAHDAEMAELGELVAPGIERQNYARLEADRHAARREYAAAFASYRKLFETPSSESLLLQEGSPVRVAADGWLSGRLVDLWRRCPEEVRGEFDRQIDALAQQTLAGSLPDQERFAAAFGFHPGSLPIRWRLIETRTAMGDFLAAENLLTALHRDSATSAEALQRLSGLMQRFELRADAAHFNRELERTAAAASAAKDDAADAQERRPADLPLAAPFKLADWGGSDLAILRGGVNYNPVSAQELSVPAGALPYFQTRRLQVYQQEQRFAVVDVFREELEWFQPLRAAAEGVDDGPTEVRVSGHQVVLLHRGILECLSPVERKVLWSRAVNERPGVWQYGNQSQRTPPAPLTSGSEPTLLDHLARDSASGGMIRIANARHVCYQDRRTLVALDATTGEVRWRRDGIHPGSLVEGDEDILYVISPDRNTALALRTIDGGEIPVANLIKHFGKAVHLSGKFLLMVEQGALDGARRKFSLRLYDPVAEKTLWKREFSGGTLISPLSHDQLAVLERSGEFRLLELEGGRLRSLGAISQDEFNAKSEAFAFADYENIYLVVNQQRGTGHYSEALPSLAVNGKIHAFDARLGKERWMQSVSGQDLVLERLEHSPVLVFSTRKFEGKGNLNYWNQSLAVLDKQSGRKLLSTTTPSQAGFQTLSVNLAERYVELRSYNERIRLTPKDPAPTAP